MRHAEYEYISGILRLLYKYRDSDPVDMSFIKENVENYLDFELNGDDLKPFGSRSVNEPSYKQVIGNLISHKKAALFKNIDVIPNLLTKKLFYKINLSGISYVESILGTEPKIRRRSKKTQKYRQFTIFDEYEEGEKTVTTEKFDEIPKQDCIVLEESQLSKSLNMEQASKRACDACGNNDTTRKTYSIIPAEAATDFFPINIHVNANTMVLCDSCSKKFNDGSAECRKDILRVVLDKKRQELAAANIFVGSESNIAKYYERRNKNGF